MTNFNTIDDLGDLSGKRVLVRVDINVPMADGKVTDDTRMRAAVPTIREILDKGGKPILLAHFGRPKGKQVPELSLKPLAGPMAELLGSPVTFSEQPREPEAGEAVLVENTRFTAMEEANDPKMAQFLASCADFYVNDAFSAAHRAHASTEGVAKLLPSAAGRLMQAELEALNTALGQPVRPVVAVVGGAKVSTKIDLLKNLVGKVDVLAIGGGMANTFLHADGVNVGKSLCEAELAGTVKEIQAAAEKSGCEILLPVDYVCAKEFAANAANRVCKPGEVADDEMILDAGPESAKALVAKMADSKTVIWNGPLGAFEIEPFDTATVAAAKGAAELAKSGEITAVAGGGDTVAALNHAGAAKDFTFISTAGGAFLEWMEGKALPGVVALSK